MDERDGRIAFVAEQFEIEDAFRLSGRFDVHWEELDEELGQGQGDGPRGVSVDEAIAWGRRHARFVCVRVGEDDTHYSAGELHLADLWGRDEEPYPTWPADGTLIRPRPMGTPWDGSVQEIDWLIEAEVDSLPEHGENELARLRAALESDDSLGAVELFGAGERSGIRPFGAPGPDLRMRCTVRARGADPALVYVVDAFEQALAVAFPGHDAWGGGTTCLGPVHGVRDG